MNAVNKERIQLWVDALESGDFKQGTRRLAHTPLEGDDKGQLLHCCLGVACEVYQREVGGLEVADRGLGDRVVRGYDRLEDHLPSVVREWFGLTYENPEFLAPEGDYELEDEDDEVVREMIYVEAAALNDGETHTGDSYSFAEIAEAIKLTFLTETPEATA